MLDCENILVKDFFNEQQSQTHEAATSADLGKPYHMRTDMVHTREKNCFPLCFSAYPDTGGYY